jgi:penicillin-binding protein 2
MLVRRDADDIREIRPRAAFGALVVVCAMLVLILQLYKLQILHGEEYLSQSLSNFRKSLFVPADRGLIKDRHGKTLVENRPSYDVFLTPAFCKGKQKDDVMARLAEILKMEDEDKARMRRDYDKAIFSKDKLERFKPYLIQIDIPRDIVDSIEAHRQELTCVDLIPSPHRSYKGGNLFGHVLGYMSEVKPDEMEKYPEYRRGQTIGRSGVERRFEKDLRGVDGTKTIAVDAQGRQLAEEANQALIPDEERYVAATPGNNLVLSLDSRVQELADQAFPGRAGAVVVMEAQTGFILAMLSRPSFDPNKMSMRISAAEYAALNDDTLKPLINRAIGENYHPGSTFKVVTSFAGLDKGAISVDSSIFCNGGYTVGNHRWRCDKPSGHGGLTVKRAITYSCDSFYYAVGDRVGLDPIAEWARKLGYGAPTGLDLGREIPGVIPDTESVIKVFKTYTKGHAINASIGQGEVNVTPLQTAVAYAAIGNGGTVLRPQIVRRIESPEGRLLQEFQPDIVRKIDFKPQNLSAVQAGLFGVVNEPGGTAYGSRLDWIKFAGKTGTAQVVTLGSKQKLNVEAQQYLSRDHAWFAAYAPAINPEIVVVVINEHGGWGGTASAPTASKIIAGYFALKAQDEAEVRAQQAAALQVSAEGQVPRPALPSPFPPPSLPLPSPMPPPTQLAAPRGN